jgi:hypothetical protein
VFDRYFVDWYRLVEIEPLETAVTARKQAAIDAAGEIEPGQLVGLIELAHARSSVAAKELAETLRGRFQAADSTFRMTGNDFEMSVLAAAICARTAETGGTKAAFVTLACESAQFMGWKPAVPVLTEVAHKALIQQSHEVRAAGLPPKGPNLALLRKGADTLAESPADAAAITEFGKLVVGTATGLGNAIAAAGTFARAVAVSAAEQAAIMWWMLGQVESETLSPWEDFPRDSRPLRMADDLARLTDFLPGPRAIGAIMSRALANANVGELEPTTVKACVEATVGDWRAAIAARSPSHLDPVAPVTATIRAGSARDSRWASAVRRETGFNIGRKLQPQQIGMQFYTERLMVAAHAQLGK